MSIRSALARLWPRARAPEPETEPPRPMVLVSSAAHVEDDFWTDPAGYETAADTSEFAAWCREIDEVADLTRRRLDALYIEFCCTNKVRPLGCRAFEKTMHAAGIFGSRPRVHKGATTKQRPTIYRIEEPPEELAEAA